MLICFGSICSILQRIILFLHHHLISFIFQSMQAQDRYLFLFDDVLLVAKQK